MQWDVLLKAGAVSGVIFAAGLIAGIWLDASRIADIESRISEIDIAWNDARLNSQLFQSLSLEDEHCDSAFKSNIDFNEKIYRQGVDLERAEGVNRFSPLVLMEKKRYTLLQLQFWMNSAALKKRCGFNYSTLIYFYSNLDESKSIEQKAQSNVILDLIEKCGAEKLNSVPIPADMNITSVDTLKRVYKITDVPALLINEDVVLLGAQSKDAVEKYVKC